MGLRIPLIEVELPLINKFKTSFGPAFMIRLYNIHKHKHTRKSRDTSHLELKQKGKYEECRHVTE